MSDSNAPAQSALYNLAKALIRSGAIEPADLCDAADQVQQEGDRDDPDNEAWDEFAHALRLAALNLPDDIDEPVRPKLDVIDGGKA